MSVTQNLLQPPIQLSPDAITKVIIAGREFKVVPDKPIMFSQVPRRCHVLCLSDKAHDKELFELFKADICIGINVTKLLALIKTANKHLGLKIIADSITYYKHENEIISLSQEQLAFVKPANPYSREHEFRIAVFWPQDGSSQLATESHGNVNVFHASGASNDHIKFNFESPAYEEVVHSITRT